MGTSAAKLRGMTSAYPTTRLAASRRLPARLIAAPLRYFPVPLSCGTMQVAVPVTSLPARSRAVTVR